MFEFAVNKTHLVSDVDGVQFAGDIESMKDGKEAGVTMYYTPGEEGVVMLIHGLPDGTVYTKDGWMDYKKAVPEIIHRVFGNTVHHVVLLACYNASRENCKIGDLEIEIPEATRTELSPLVCMEQKVGIGILSNKMESFLICDAGKETYEGFVCMYAQPTMPFLSTLTPPMLREKAAKNAVFRFFVKLGVAWFKLFCKFNSWWIMRNR